MLVDIVRLTDKEKGYIQQVIDKRYNELVAGITDDSLKADIFLQVQGELKQTIENNENQTLVILRQLKVKYKWVDIEDMFNFVELLKKVDIVEACVNITNKEEALVKKVFDSVVKEGLIESEQIDKYHEVLGCFYDR
jgi:hypothetical protein